MTFEVMT